MVENFQVTVKEVKNKAETEASEKVARNLKIKKLVSMRVSKDSCDPLRRLKTSDIEALVTVLGGTTETKMLSWTELKQEDETHDCVVCSEETGCKESRLDMEQKLAW
ncbi:hypothetical protein Bca4012_084254 [Brassica carinata]|uniref:Uncharacterized protein n=1 Tax=Brassica carinata TaxID=52824 RepID=A0A8X7SI52_BRACI|nr:hypothetical protein Bca52824_026526 [Brassica carinata]